MSSARHPGGKWPRFRDEGGRRDDYRSETAIFACYAIDADRQGGPFLTLPVFVYLSGTCPRPVVDCRAPSGHGLLCAPVIWELEKDSAASELRKVASREASWDALFWAILMNGGTDEALLLWRRLLDEKVPAKRRNDVAYNALELAALAGCLPALERLRGDVKMKIPNELEHLSRVCRCQPLILRH